METHQIKEGHPFYNWAVQECSLNTSLYNRTLYILRQAFTGKHDNIPEYADLIKKERFISKFDLMAENKIGNCFIGHNDGWKQEVNIGKRNNQNFVSIPHSQLIWMMEYKAKEAGVNVETHNESHTSKCSFLDNEDICHHDEYIGKRKKRGLFVSSDGRMLNADINGAANILRRGLDKTFVPHKAMFNPIKIDIEKKHPMSVSDQGVEGEGFTHCLSNPNTLSLAA